MKTAEEWLSLYGDNDNVGARWSLDLGQSDAMEMIRAIQEDARPWQHWDCKPLSLVPQSQGEVLDWTPDVYRPTTEENVEWINEEQARERFAKPFVDALTKPAAEDKA